MNRWDALGIVCAAAGGICLQKKWYAETVINLLGFAAAMWMAERTRRRV